MKGAGRVRAGLARLAEDCAEQDLFVLELIVAERRGWRDWNLRLPATAGWSDASALFVVNWGGIMMRLSLYLLCVFLRHLFFNSVSHGIVFKSISSY